MEFSLLLLLMISLPLVANSQVCSELQSSDLGDTTAASTVGLLADTLMSVNMLAENPSVQILESNTVCLSQGSVKDTYTYVSVVVRYTADGNESTLQVSYMCSAGTWVSTFGTYVVENNPVANFTTPLRTDCILCIDPAVAPATVVNLITEVEHCTSKSTRL